MPQNTPTIVIEADEHDVPRVASLDSIDPREWEEIAHRAFLTSITPYARALHPRTAPSDGIEEVDDEGDDDDPAREVRDESAQYGFEWLESIENGRLTIRADGRRYSFDPKRWPDNAKASAWLLGSVRARRLELAAIEAVRVGRFTDPSVRKIVDRDREASRSTRLGRMMIQHEGLSWDPSDPYTWGSEWASLDIDVKRRVIAEGEYIHADGRVFAPLDREVAAADLLEEAESDEKAHSRLPGLSSGMPAATPARPKVTAAEVENRVLRFVKIADDAGEPLSKRQVRDRVSGGTAAIDAALSELVNRGELVTEAGPRNATLYRIAKADEE
jgi:hypothetical protein